MILCVSHPCQSELYYFFVFVFVRHHMLICQDFVHRLPSALFHVEHRIPRVDIWRYPFEHLKLMTPVERNSAVVSGPARSCDNISGLILMLIIYGPSPTAFTSF